MESPFSLWKWSTKEIFPKKTRPQLPKSEILEYPHPDKGTIQLPIKNRKIKRKKNQNKKLTQNTTTNNICFHTFAKAYVFLRCVFAKKH